MAIFTRIVAAAALVSFALAPVASASAADVYGVAQQRARAAAHHERAAHINANTGGELKKRAIAKRCAAQTTSLSSTHTTTSHKTSTTTHHTTTVKQNPVKTTTTAPHTTTTKASSGSKKKGIAWSGTNSQLDQYLVNDNIKFIYNWGATPPQPSGVLSCTMLWGTKMLASFKSNRDSYDCLMGPNEFNLAAQSGLSVSEVYQYWKDEIVPYKGQKTLIAPSVTTASTGLSDMQELMKLCAADGIDDCAWDAVSVHFYGKSADDLISWTTTFREGLNYPTVWITEWACQSFVEVAGGEDCTSDEVWAMMEAVTAWAEETSWIGGYAPYGFSEDLGNVAEVNALMSPSGDITSLGEWYINN